MKRSHPIDLLTPERKTAFCRSRGTRSISRVSLRLCWIAALHLMWGNTATAQGVCDRTPQVRDKLVEDISGVSDCADITTAHLGRLGELDLSGAGILALQEGDFSGLRTLVSLDLSGNHLKTLPEGVFSGLADLAELRLHRNKLILLPDGVFRGLDSLRLLWLHRNSMNNFLRELPFRIFDDVFDTLEDLRVDPYHKSGFNFVSTEQRTATGYTVRVGVRLMRSMTSIGGLRVPAVVRVPYSVEGTASSNMYTGLPPSSERELLFRGGGLEQIVFTISEEAARLGKTVVLTLGELSEVGLRPFDGAGPDAPFLKAESLINHSGEGSVHTVTIVDPVPADICGRTPQVRDRLMEALPEVGHCAEVSTAHLTGVRRLDLRKSNILALQANDFSGLSGLEILFLSDNSLTSLPHL